MAKPEQTEKPTGKRIHETRQKGQVARSPDIASAAVFLAAVFTLHASMLPTISLVGSTLHGYLDHLRDRHDLNIFSAWGLFAQFGAAFFSLMGILLLTSLVLAIAANVAQFGFLFTLQKLQPRFSVLNPISGFKNRFLSIGVLVGLGKQLLKLAAILLICLPVLIGSLSSFYTVSQTSPHQIVEYMNDLVFGMGWRFGILLLVIGLADFAYERWHLMDSLKMTKQEVKDEHKQYESSPEVRQAVKRRQREAARRRMMAAVPKATVVITNPTHYAVALEWDEIKMEAPVLTAKGADLIAKRIRDIARENKVPVIENAPLARTIYERVDLDSAVPPNLYAAVAQVIAFVYKLKNRTIA